MRCFTICLLALLITGIARLGSAQDASTPRRIGVLFWHESPNDELAFEGFRSGLEIGGLRPVFDVRMADSRVEEANRHLKRWNTESYDLILAMGTRAAQLARAQITGVPVVYTAVTNPVLSAVADRWESSGANIAGNSNWIPAETLFRAFARSVPGMTRLGVIASPDNPVPVAEIEGARQALKRSSKHRFELMVRWVRDPLELTSAAESLVGVVDAIWIPIDILVYENLHRIRKVTDPGRIPLLSSSHRAAEEGAIVSLLVDYGNLGKNAAAIAMKILADQADPASIPVGRLEGYRTIVNLKRSREIGYRLPLEVLCTADRILR